MTEHSQISPDLTLYFVLPNKYSFEDECTTDMKTAYDEAVKIELKPTWITESDCHRVTPSKTDVFVMEDFEGDLFKKLCSSRCSVIGPRCLTACIILDEAIPYGPNPIFTTAMSGLCICVSGMTAETKQHIKDLVHYMGGVFTDQLRTSVTHLVTESVMSAKYESAAEMKITIVTKEWVEAVWNASLKDFIKADDVIFEKYKAPIFLNLVVTTTNLSKHEKDQIKRLINDNGGTYMGPLDGSLVKLVLAPANSAISEKLKYAKQANIACLTPDWVYESLKAGYSMPFKDFLIQSFKACSTPERSAAHETFNCSSISCIPSDYQHKNVVEESLATTISNSSTMQCSSNTSVETNTLDRLTLREAKLAGPFLDGCNIYLTGFAPNQKDKLNRILNVGGATRLDDISDALTHVIIGDEVKATNDLKLMKSKGLSPILLTLEWLEESMKIKQPASEENFLFELKNSVSQQQPTEPPSPLSKKNLQMLQKPKRPPIPSFNLDKKPTPVQKKPAPDFLQQYFTEPTITDNDPSLRIDGKQNGPAVESKKIDTRNSSLFMEPHRTRQSAITDHDQNNEDTVVMSQPSALNDKLFDGQTFVVTGFDDLQMELVQTIMAFGGKIVPRSYAGIPDYGIVPINGAPLQHTVNEIVTNFYIDDCITQEAIVDIEYYHRPLSLNKHSKPLSDCIITMSTYAGAERSYLTALAAELGAVCQDIFARRTNVEKKTLGSTHLICRSPEGNKYNAAVRWKLPAVKADWLLQCANELRRVHEGPYLVGETVAPEPSPQSKTAENSISNTDGNDIPMQPTTNIRTPKRHLPALDHPGSGTPDSALINKRLSLITNQTTPDSPFHVATPESPYGQVFKANPSPATRKEWVKWTNNFPDLREKEVPIRRRAPSTPLSELKRQLMEKVVKSARAMANLDHSFDTADEHESNEQANECNEINNANGDKNKTPINRKLDYADENCREKYDNINLEILHLDQVLERTSNTPKSRCSLISQKSQTDESDHEKGPVLDSQPVEAIGWEDPSHSKWSKMQRYSNRYSSDSGTAERDNIEEEGKSQEHRKRPRFMLSCIQDRSAYEKVIRELGGDVSLDSNFDDTATHLLCTKPLRNEKMLSSIASGKWVLHSLYLRDSEEEGKFLDEERYEWGNPKSDGVIPKPSSDTEWAIARAAFRWRQRLQIDSRGPFHDMVALLLVSSDKYDQFKRLIEAGGGQVLQARPPYDTSPTGRKITHCFVGAKQASQPTDWATMASKGILCFFPQYLHDHLAAETPRNPRECVIPQFKKYLTLLPK